MESLVSLRPEDYSIDMILHEHFGILPANDTPGSRNKDEIILNRFPELGEKKFLSYRDENCLTLLRQRHVDDSVFKYCQNSVFEKARQLYDREEFLTFLSKYLSGYYDWVTHVHAQISLPKYCLIVYPIEKYNYMEVRGTQTGAIEKSRFFVWKSVKTEQVHLLCEDDDFLRTKLMKNFDVSQVQVSIKNGRVTTKLKHYPFYFIPTKMKNPEAVNFHNPEPKVNRGLIIDLEEFYV